MESPNPEITDNDRFAHMLENTSPENRVFYESLKGTPYYEHYKRLFLRYSACQGTVVDFLRIVAFDLHSSVFVTRRRIAGCFSM